MMAHPYDTTTFARTDRSGMKLLCGYQDLDGVFCPGRMALIEHFRATPHTHYVLFMRLEPGFSRDEQRVWRLSQNAQRRRERGYTAKYRTSSQRVSSFVMHGPDSPVWREQDRVGPRGERQQDGSVWPSHVPLTVDR